MNVKDLVEQIISYSHNEDTPDTQLSVKALQWLNAAYLELLQENLAFLKNKMVQSVSVEMVNGEILLPTDFYLFEQLLVTNNNQIVNNQDKDCYKIDEQSLIIDSKITSEVVLSYIPVFQELTEDDSLAQMHISSNYIQGLIWGALVWSSIYERGLHTQAELAIFERKWNEAKQNYKITLAAYSDQLLRTKPYSFLN